MNRFTASIVGSFFLTALFLSILTLIAVQAEAKNPDVSNWTLNLSESAADTELGEEDFAQEIEVVGNTVHVLWITRNADYSGHRLYYRRSTDGGQTWNAKQLIFEDDDLVISKSYKRMVVNDTTVHIAFSYYSGSWYGVLGYTRSSDNGASFEPVRNLFIASNAYHVYDVRLAESAGKVTIGFRNQCNWLVNNSYTILNSDDNGDSFVSHTVYGTEAGNGWNVADLQRVDDRIYVLYTDSYYYYGLQYSRLYIAASSDAGAHFTSTRISVPSANGEDKTYSLHDYHYVPKIAGVGDTVTVIWSALDANDVHSVFIRRSEDAGVTFSDALNLTDGQVDDAKALQAGQETIAAQGNYVYCLFPSTAGNVYLRRSADGGGSFFGLQELTSANAPYISYGWWPVIKTDPTVASGAKVHVLWTWPTYVYSSNGGATFTKPELVTPYFSYSGSTTSGALGPQMAIDTSGRVHFTVESRYYSANFGGYGDFDTHYRVLSPPLNASGDNNALHLVSDSNARRQDNLQVPACDDLNFTSKMSAEVWVRPYADGMTTGSTSQIKPIFHKLEEYNNFSYSLQTWDSYGQRQARAQIQTTDGTVTLFPADSAKGLVPEGIWSHLAFTYDATAGSDNFKLYLNGQLIATTTATGDLATGDGIFLAGYYGTWDITELRLWNLVRTPEELKANMYKALEKGATGLMAYYRFKNTSKDFSGRGHDGLLMYQEQYLQQSFIKETSAANMIPVINALLLE